MSPRAVVCPHCGARQADRDPIEAKAPKKPLRDLTKEETAALLLVHGVDRSSVGGHEGVAAIFLPHPASTDLSRWIQILLTVVAVPAIVSGAPMLLFTRRSRAMLRDSSGVWAHVLLALSGGSGLYFSLVFSPVGAVTNAVLTGASSGALVVRGIMLAFLDRRRRPPS